MTRVILVQCTGKKRGEAAQPRDLYDESDYFRKQREYALVAGDEWRILSAKHHVLHPDGPEIEPYDKHLRRDLTKAERVEWGKTVAEDLLSDYSRGDTVENLGGKDYADYVTPHLEEQGIEVLEPLRGLGIGKRKSRLPELTAAERPDLEGFL